MKHTKTAILAGLALLAAACAAPTGSNNNYNNNNNTPSGGHDGTAAAPVVLTLGTPFSGKIGATTDLSNSESFYRFTTGSSDTSLLVAVNQSAPAHTGNLDWDLRVYSDAAMTNQILLASPNDHTAPYATLLSPSTTYYVKLFNTTASATTFTITAQTPPAYKHDGSLPPGGSPMILFSSGAQSVSANMVVTSLSNENISYYAFTAPASGTATISYPEGILNGTLYSDNTYANPAWLAEETSTSAKSFTATVTSGTSYYLAIQHWGSDPTRITGPLTVTIQ